MRRPSILLLCLIGLGVPVQSQSGERAPSRQKPDPAAAIQKLVAECDASKVAHPKRHEHFRARFEAFAKKHRGTEAGLTAELWLLTGTWWSMKQRTINAKAGVIARRILEYSFHSKRLGELMDRGYLFSTEQKEELFAKALQVSKFPEVKGAAHLALGKLLIESGDEERRTEGVEHLKTLQEKFTGIPYRGSRLGALADAMLTPADGNPFEIGKPAPEIEGVSVHGQPMRLSDYRGKIVVLDFWGDW